MSGPTFDAALDAAIRFLAEHPDLGARRLLVRDLQGRIRIFFADREDPQRGLTQLLRARLDALRPELHAQLGRWSAGPKHLLSDANLLFDLDSAWGSPDALRLDATTRLLERTLIGQDWLRAAAPNALPRPARATLFGLKGGVGRSTALAVWARHLSEQGRRVLVVDLDLEAPGVSSLLLPEDARPDLGVVDWFVESLVNPDVRLEAGRSPLSSDEGEILVVPAAGARTGQYIPKLARVYQGDGHREFGDRLAELVDQLEADLRPDVVLLDSRAGLHDVAAVALTRLGALGLLFAVDTPQTWAGYRMLFEHWQRHIVWRPDALDPVRKNLHFVAGQIPETDRDRYLQRLRDRAWSLLCDTLYDSEEDGDFWFPEDDRDAPHAALEINWSRVLQDYDPVGRPEAVAPNQRDAAFADFLARATGLLLGTS